MSEQMMICTLKCEQCHTPAHNVPHVCIKHTCADGKCVPYVPSQPVKPEMDGLLNSYQIVKLDSIDHNNNTMYHDSLLQAQRDLTLSQCQQQEQERMRELFEELEKPCPHVHKVFVNRLQGACGYCMDILKAKYQSSKGGK